MKKKKLTPFAWQVAEIGLKGSGLINSRHQNKRSQVLLPFFFITLKPRIE